MPTATKKNRTNRKIRMELLDPDQVRRLLDEPVQPQVRQLFLNRVRLEPASEGVEIDAIKPLILIEARENNALLAGRGIHVLLQALRADLFHHALHR